MTQLRVSNQSISCQMQFIDKVGGGLLFPFISPLYLFPGAVFIAGIFLLENYTVCLANAYNFSPRQVGPTH